MVRRRIRVAILPILVAYLISLVPPSALAYDAGFSPRDLFGIQQGGTFQHLPQDEIVRQLDGMQSLRATWLRLDMQWAHIQAGGPTSYDWARYDFVLAGAAARGIKVLAIVGYTPVWARPAGSSDKTPPTNIADYVTFVRAAVTRYSVAPYGVKHWEIWNEPNHHLFWAPKADPARYTQLLKQAYTAIKQKDPTAFVVSGGMSPAADNGSDIAPRTFLTAMYQNGAKGYFDALGHHPYTIPYAPDNDPTVGGGDPNWSAWYIMAASSTSLRSIMVARGDGAKKIWATEWGYPTTGGSSAVSEEQQAEYLKRGLALFASYPWAGPIFVYKYHDDCTDAANRDCGHGLTRLDYSEKPAYATFASITADTVAPTVAIESPATGTKVRSGSTVTLQATASDAIGVSSVVFYVNGVEQCRDATSGFSCAWTVPSKRGVQYTVEARAYDINGNQASRTVRVTSS